MTRKLDDGPEVKKIDINGEIQNDIAKITVDSLSRHIEDVEGGQVRLRSLDIGNTVGGGSIIQWEQIENLPDTPLFRILSSRTDDGLTKYSTEPKPDFHFVRICEPRGPILIGLQTHTDFTSVDTTTEVAITDDSEGYRKVQDDLLILKPRFSAVCYDGWLFVIKSKTFESVFGLREKYLERGQEVIDTLTDSGITFADHDKTKEWLLSHIYMLRGMYEIYQYNIHNQLTPEMVRKWIDRYAWRIDILSIMTGKKMKSN